MSELETLAIVCYDCRPPSESCWVIRVSGTCFSQSADYGRLIDLVVNTEWYHLKGVVILICVPARVVCSGFAWSPCAVALSSCIKISVTSERYAFVITFWVAYHKALISMWCFIFRTIRPWDEAYSQYISTLLNFLSLCIEHYHYHTVASCCASVG